MDTVITILAVLSVGILPLLVKLLGSTRLVFRVERMTSKMPDWHTAEDCAEPVQSRGTRCHDDESHIPSPARRLDYE